MILRASENIIAQSKCRILHALHELRKKRARKTSVLQADSKVAFHTITSSISLFGLSTLRTNHKLCKKLANRKRRSTYVLVTRDSNTILCTNSPFADALYKRFRASATQAIAQKFHEFWEKERNTFQLSNTDVN